MSELLNRDRLHHNHNLHQTFVQLFSSTFLMLWLGTTAQNTQTLTKVIFCLKYPYCIYQDIRTANQTKMVRRETHSKKGKKLWSAADKMLFCFSKTEKNVVFFFLREERFWNIELFITTGRSVVIEKFYLATRGLNGMWKIFFKLYFPLLTGGFDPPSSTCLRIY